jgi:hypothetical protein
MLLSTAYLPPISYFQKIASSENFRIEKHEHFVKQTYRNRCHIYGANGVQSLSIPLVNTHEKTLITKKKIAYKQNWQQQHWRSLESAYRNSPYFIYYQDELKLFYEKEFEFLFDYNTALLKTLLKVLKLNVEFGFTDDFEKEAAKDHRNIISPKNPAAEKDCLHYAQVFEEKHGFKADLSIVDLLFNTGPKAAAFLKS